MNLVDGRILNTDECKTVVDDLEERILNTLAKDRLYPQVVVNACDRLVRELDEESYLQIMENLGIGREQGLQYLTEARQLFNRESLTIRLKKELGEDYLHSDAVNPVDRIIDFEVRTAPLGVLLHIAAGNAHGLPAFSVLEGLLAGNINILKLPSQEGGISVKLLSELIRIEPKLSEYIYVFDYSSKDIKNVGKLIDACDAVVVWGGSEAVSSIRTLVPSHIKLIEWGHKICFAYVTTNSISKTELMDLAHNIASTGQLLCSSIQGIFVDTDDMEQVYDFCSSLLPILDEACAKSFFTDNIGIQTQSALRIYNSQLEGIYSPRRIYRGRSCSLTAYHDRILETSFQYGNAWVRPLPRDEIIKTLRPYKNFLQTTGLLCCSDDWGELSQLLFKTGIVRVCRCINMSVSYTGEAHDGEYPLRRYVKITNLIM